MNKEHIPDSINFYRGSLYEPLVPHQQIAQLKKMREIEQRMMALLQKSTKEQSQKDIISHLQKYMLARGAPTKSMTDELIMLAQEWRELRNRITRANCRFVVSIAKRYAQSPYEYDEAIQIGISKGLERAIELFEPHKGFAFSTYAAFWIVDSVRRHLAKLRREVSVQDFDKKYNEKQEESSETFFPTKEPSLTVEEEVELLLLPKWLRESGITEQEQYILKLHYGLIDNKPLTLDECAQWLFENGYTQKKLTAVRIGQLEKDALKKLKKFLKG